MPLKIPTGFFYRHWLWNLYGKAKNLVLGKEFLDKTRQSNKLDLTNIKKFFTLKES